ncbi:ribose-5-phosphate isomerase [Aeromonas hydrophila]|nr:ribose-5-phosphate isomerase [Aeromonas hydrophila]
MPAKRQLNGIMVGTVAHGLFAYRGVDLVVIGTPDGVVIN